MGATTTARTIPCVDTSLTLDLYLATTGTGTLNRTRRETHTMHSATQADRAADLKEARLFLFFCSGGAMALADPSTMPCRSYGARLRTSTPAAEQPQQP